LNATYQIIIGIAGVSESGKSTLTEALETEFQKRAKQVDVFDIDQFTIEESLIPKINDRINWEVPESIDWKKLLSHIEESKADLIIVEGIFAYHSSLLGRYNKTILLEVDYETFMKRRKAESRWGDEPQWYMDHVWNSNNKLLTEFIPDLKLDTINTTNLQLVIDLIEDVSKKNTVDQ
jgi:uridine kinase